MNLKKMLLVLLLVVVGSASVFAFTPEVCQEVLENGEEMTLEGILSSENGSTYFTVGRDKYEVLRGPGMFSYEDGAKVELTGLVFEMQILPNKIRIGGIELELKGGRGRGSKDGGPNRRRSNNRENLGDDEMGERSENQDEINGGDFNRGKGR